MDEERLANMMDCCTMIGDSLSKSDKNEPK